MSKLQDFLNLPLNKAAASRRQFRAGDLFGVELECEGRRVDFQGEEYDLPLLKGWMPMADGSLRAHHGSACEWVFNGPVSYKNSVDRINVLFDFFDKQKAGLVCSNRTSTHVHYNMGDKSVYQLVNLFILFTIFEDLLDRYCGETRRGNLFCLSSRHAEAQVNWISDALFKNYKIQYREDLRYCSLNLASINKFGTVEFRGMRGLDNREDMLSWLSIVNELCDYACYKMTNPVNVIESISKDTPEGFMQKIFSADNFAKITKDVDIHEIRGSIYEGMRLVQMLCYRIGTEFDQVRLRGRDFWASFSVDAEPVPDVDPDQLRVRKPLMPNRFRNQPRAQRLDPEWVQPPVEHEAAAGRGADRLAQALADARRFVERDRVGAGIGAGEWNVAQRRWAVVPPVDQA